MIWRHVDKADPRARRLADKHYSRRTPGAVHFTPPGRDVVLWTPGAVWASVWMEHIDHQWAPCWSNTLFRNTGAGLSSDLIRDAVAATLHEWGDPPEWGMVSFVDSTKIRSTNPGFCFLRAGFERVGRTQGGHGRSPLDVLVLRPERMPDPCPALREQLTLSMGATP